VVPIPGARSGRRRTALGSAAGALVADLTVGFITSRTGPVSSLGVPDAKGIQAALVDEAEVALRDAIVTTKELVGTHGAYNFRPDSRDGSDERARVVVKLDKGQWKLVQ
jgi:hypothetical protein